MAGITIPGGPGGPGSRKGKGAQAPKRPSPQMVSDAGSGGPNQARRGANFNRGPNARARNLHGLSTDQVRIILRHNGYNIEHTGGMTARLHTAMNSYISGANPKQWNENNPDLSHMPANSLGDPPHANIGPAHPAAHVVPHAGAHPAAVHAAAKGGKSSPLSLQGLVNIAENAGIPIPQSVVDQIGSDFGAAVTSDKQNLSLQDKQSAQNQQDIANWFGQVLGAQHTAAGRDTAATSAGVNSVQDAVAKIVASLGGSANAGSADVGAAGANDVGTLQAMGTAQDQYNNDIAPLLKEEAASQHVSQSARDAQTRLKLAQQLSADQGQQANEKANAQMQVDTQNSNIRQQKFGDMLSLAQENDARRALGIKAASLMIPKPASSSAIAKAASGAYGQFTVKDANGNTVANLKDAKGNPLPVQTVVKRVNNAYLASGLNLNDPTIASSAMGVLRQLGIQPDPGWYGMG